MRKDFYETSICLAHLDEIFRHPLSVDALCGLPAELPGVDAQSTVLTGSSDGYVRAVQILPTKLLGVVADHGEWPIERIAIGNGHHQVTIGTGGYEAGSSKVTGKQPEEDRVDDADVQRRWWVGSVGHEDVLRMTDLEGFFRDNEGNEDENKGALGVDVSEDDSDIDENVEENDDADEGDKPKISQAPDDSAAKRKAEDDKSVDSDEEAESDDSDGEPEPQHLKRKAKKALPISAVKKRKAGKNSVAADPSFFDDL